MKTTIALILCCSLSIAGFSQVKTNTTTAIKTKPVTAATKTSTASIKSTPTAERHKKQKDNGVCKMERSCVHCSSHIEYECPKCDYESQDSGTGKCPNDGAHLKHVQEHDSF